MVGGWAGLTAGLEAMEKRKTFTCRESNLDCYGYSVIIRFKLGNQPRIDYTRLRLFFSSNIQINLKKVQGHYGIAFHSAVAWSRRNIRSNFTENHKNFVLRCLKQSSGIQRGIHYYLVACTTEFHMFTSRNLGHNLWLLWCVYVWCYPLFCMDMGLGPSL
jgi:hypothetical protein